MSNIIETTPETGLRQVDVSRGEHRWEVSSQWFSRPDDQKYLDLDTLYQATLDASQRSTACMVNTRDIRVLADSDDAESLQLVMPRGSALRDINGSKMSGTLQVDSECSPTHWSFGQVCSLVKTPAQYLRRLPGQIAGINLQYGLTSFREELLKAYVMDNGHAELRAATGPDYGRIHDHEIVRAVRKIAGDGTGKNGYHWKVPGCIDWGTMQYDPDAPITKQSTTLFASDRDIFLFLVDDRHPIEIGKLPNGDPDLIFRGFYVWNSEVGSRSFGIATMYLRAVCGNRCLWGVEGYQEIKFRHSKYAPERFMREAKPALDSFTNNNTRALTDGIQSARDAIVAKNDDDAKEFLGRQKFTAKESKAIMDSVLQLDQKPARSIWDMVQGITAVARDKGHQDERVAMERRAGKLLDKVA